MKCILDKLKDDINFQFFFKKIKNSANYFMATQGDIHGINLVLADAYAAGKNEKENECCDTKRNENQADKKQLGWN